MHPLNDGAYEAMSVCFCVLWFLVVLGSVAGDSGWRERNKRRVSLAVRTASSAEVQPEDARTRMVEFGCV